MKYKILAMLLVLFVLTSCAPSVINKENPSTTNTIEFFSKDFDSDVQKFNSEEEFKAFMSSFGSEGYYRDGMLAKGGAMLDGAVMVETMDVSSTVQNEGLDYSQTNVQVQNIDEGDILKTNGEYIYTITDKTLFVIKAYPGEDSKVILKHTFDNYPQGMFLNEDKLAVYGRVSDYSDIDDIRPGTQLTFLQTFDISNNELDLLDEKLFEGYYQQSRMIDDKIYLLTLIYDNSHLPIYYDGGLREVMPSKIHYYHMPYSSPQLVSIQSVDLSNQELVDQKVITVESGMNLYMSSNALYIATNQYINRYDIQKQVTLDITEKYLTDEDKELIDRIKNTDSDILTNYEKENKIYQIYMQAVMRLDSDKQEDLSEEVDKEVDQEMEKYEYFYYTIINKVEVDDGKLNMGESTKIPGRINNQFSMDEYQDVLRVATTVPSNWYKGESSESESHIYTLDNDLDKLDSITGIAKTENIYSTRFVNDRLYMVTFRQVDPFFVFDLYDSSNIKNLGELKIPGFSRYLHPYDENHLIGIGRDATDEGRTEGLKISLFDVSDATNPKEVAKYISSEKYSGSTAEYEHKAFLFSKEKNLLVIPAYAHNYQDTDDNYNGAMVFRIDSEEISLRGLIDHGSKSYWRSAVERSLYIEDELYTKSPNLLRINSLEDLESINRIELDPDYEGDIPIY